MKMPTLPHRPSRFQELDLDELNPQTSLPTPPPIHRNTPPPETMSSYTGSVNPYTGKRNTNWSGITLSDTSTQNPLSLSSRPEDPTWSAIPLDDLAKQKTLPPLSHETAGGAMDRPLSNADPTKDFFFYKPPKSYKCHAQIWGAVAIILLLVLVIVIPILAVAVQKAYHEVGNLTTATTTVMHTSTRNGTATKTLRMTTTVTTTTTSTPSNPLYAECAAIVNDRCAGNGDGPVFGNCSAVILDMYCLLEEGVCDVMKALCSSRR